MVATADISKGYNISRIVIFAYIVHCSKLAIVARMAPLELDPHWFLSLDFLRIICRKVLVEYHNILMRTKRHSISIQKTDWHRFLPDPFIAEPFAIGVYQIRGKWLLRK